MTELPATFGKYFLTEKLATGGMAEIYLGKLLGPGGFEKQLVIKQIHPRLAAEPHFVDLFVAEAKTLVGLTHGNIVPVYELGLVDDTYFIAMEYIDGPTLWQLTESVWHQGDAIAPALGAWIASELLDGLDYAHRKGEGVIHRDLSPRNVMLSRDGQVLLVDFGIAVPYGAGDDPGADGAPTGSFPYMSPEQVERKRLTSASDLFSLSVLLWEMLAGKRLFARPDAAMTLDAVLHGKIPAPSSVRPEVSARLDEVVLRGLERDPEKRWPSAGEFLAALNRYLYALDEPPSARELASLIARGCPPERVAAPDLGDDAPHTAIEPATSKAVEQSFATHVELQRVFGKTPLFPMRAIRDEDDEPAPRTVVHPRPSQEHPAQPAPRQRAPTRAEIRETTSWKPLAAIATLAVVVVGGSLWLLLQSPGASRAAGPARDASSPVAVAHDAGPRPTAVDAAPLPVVDAAAVPAPDAATRPPPRDASVRPPRDGSVRPPIDASVAPRDGTIKVGANPWGQVYVDGKKVGNAPGTFTVRAGHHDVTVVFPTDTGELRKTFSVDVDADETSSVFADFTGS